MRARRRADARPLARALTPACPRARAAAARIRARRARKLEPRAPPPRAEEESEAQLALQRLADKVERNRQDVLLRMGEVQELVTAIKGEVARLCK